jgi:hypothetical protein
MVARAMATVAHLDSAFKTIPPKQEHVMLAASLAPWLSRIGVHYCWVMVAITFLTTVCISAAISLPGVLLLPMVNDDLV